jgi:hypothetical protein
VNNFGQDAQLNPAKLFGRIRGASRRMGIDEAELTTAVSDALSARGDNSAQAAVDSVLAAAELAPFDAAGRQTLAGAALDLSKNNKRGLKGSLGFLQSVGQVSRVTNQRALAENATPAISGVQQFGGSEEFGGALFGAISQGAVDTKGALTNTAVIQLAKQISEFAPGAGLEGGFQALTTLPGAREDFFGKKTEGGFGATFEAKTLPVMQALLTPGTAVNRQFQTALAGLQGVSGIDAFNQRVGQINALPSVQTSRLQQGLKNAVNQVALSDQGGARSAAIREGLRDLRTQLGQGGLATGIDALMEDVDADGRLNVPQLRSGLVELRDDLRATSRGGGRRARNTERMVAGAGPDGSGAVAFGMFAGRYLGANRELGKMDPSEAASNAEVFDSLLELIDQQSQIQAKQLEQLEQMNNRAENQGNRQAVVGRLRNRGESGP